MLRSIDFLIYNRVISFKSRIKYKLFSIISISNLQVLFVE